MRIAIDLSGVRTIGTQVYCEGFVHALTRMVDQQDEVLLFLSPTAADLFTDRLPKNFGVRVESIAWHLALRLCWEQTVLPLQLARWRADVLFAPFDIAPLYAPCPVLLAIRHPGPALLRLGVREGQLSGMLKARLHERVVTWSCRVARLTMYPSQYAAELLGGILEVPPKKRVVVYHGLDAEYWRTDQGGQHLLRKHSIEPNRYIFFASQHYRQKQTDVLIEGFGLWRIRAERQRYQLILTGRTPDPEHWRKMEGIVDRMGLGQSVQFLGNVDRDLVRALYQSCAVFVMPSVMETFGHPYVEAMAAGRPLLCADTALAREICGDAAMYFTPGDSGALCETLEAMTGNPELCTSLGQTGRERSRMFSWEKEARDTLAYLRAAANGRS